MANKTIFTDQQIKDLAEALIPYLKQAAEAGHPAAVNPATPPVDGNPAPLNPPAALPQAEVVVTPSGVNATGPRYYPPNQTGEDKWGYARRISTMTNPRTGMTYVPAQILGTFMYAPAGYNFQETVDRWLFPEEYIDAVEASRQNTVKKEQDAAVHGGGTGSLNMSELTLEDAMFLNWLSTADPKYKNAWRDLTNGTWNQIANAQSIARNSGQYFDVYNYWGKVRAYATEFYSTR